jgi:hypothetical protein
MLGSYGIIYLNRTSNCVLLLIPTSWVWENFLLTSKEFLFCGSSRSIKYGNISQVKKWEGHRPFPDMLNMG